MRKIYPEIIGLRTGLRLGYLVMVVAVSLVSVWWMVACNSDAKTDSRLVHIERIIENDPAQASACLDSIDPDELREADRHLYTILAITARDKQFLKHGSDSAILSAIRYYKNRKSPYRLAQASYLAGRVYHGMGDHPSAIRYYHRALDAIPPDSSTSRLRGCILSQMATLLNELHVYTPSKHYLRESIKVDSIRADSIGLSYDYQSLASVYRNEKLSLDSAQHLLGKALNLSHLVHPKWRNRMLLDMTNTLLMRGDVDGALSWLRRSVEDTGRIHTNKYLYTAARTYHKAGMLDSAYHCAHQLAFGESDSNRKTGFEILFSDNLYDKIPKDSLRTYVFGLVDAVYKYLDKSDGHQAALQTAVYNYTVHDRDKEVAEKKVDKYSVWIDVLSIITGVSLIVTSVLVIRSQRREIKYLKSKERVRELEQENQKYKKITASGTEAPSINTESEDVIRRSYRCKFRKEMIEQARNVSDSRKVSGELQNTESYEYIQELILKEGWIKDNEIWNKIRTDVETAYPLLRERVEILAEEDLTPREWEVIWLIKLGVTATQLATLLNRTKGSISSRRVQLGLKLFGEKLSAPTVDKAVRLL